MMRPYEQELKEQIAPIDERLDALHNELEHLPRYSTLKGIAFLRNGDVVYGAAVGGRILLNEEQLNLNTPLHEYTHLWDKACQAKNPELWRRGVELMKQTALWEEVKNDPNYQGLDEDGIASEVHSRLTGKQGAARLEALGGEILSGEGSLGEKSAKMSVIARLKAWLSEFWYWLRDTFTPWSKGEAQRVTIDDFANMPLADLAKGVRLGESLREQRAEGVQPLTEEETALRDTLADVMRENGLDVITDEKEGQRVLDWANEKARLSARQKRALETVSVSQSEEHPQTAISSADGAKILNSLDNLISEYENSAITKEKTFIGRVAEALGVDKAESEKKDKDKQPNNGKSRYATFETVNGKIVTIRLGNHNAKVSNFDNHGEKEGISIVVSPKENNGIIDDGDAHVMEYFYDAIKLRRAEGKPLAEIVKSIKQALYSGEFKDTTGLAEPQEVNAQMQTVEGEDGKRFFRTANGEAYGYTVGGKIYFDPKIATSETPIHEYTHLWATALQKGNPAEWENVVSLMKGTPIWNEVKERYPELKTDSEIADEVLAHYSGRRGAERLREEQRRITESEGTVTSKAAALDAIGRVKRALQRFWKAVADFLHIHYTTAEEVADRVMKDLLNGVDPRAFGVDSRLREQFVGEKGRRQPTSATVALPPWWAAPFCAASSCASSRPICLLRSAISLSRSLSSCTMRSTISPPLSAAGGCASDGGAASAPPEKQSGYNSNNRL